MQTVAGQRMTNIYPDLLQFFRHPRPAIAAKAQARLFLDMGQNNHVHALPAAGRTAAEGPQATRADIHHLAKPICRKGTYVFFDKPEPHGVGQSLGPMAFLPSIARKEHRGLF